MRHLRLFEEFNTQENFVRHAAWLYFVTYVYRDGMQLASWKTDERMGVVFTESMDFWTERGLVKRDGDLFYVADTDKAKSVLYDTFGRYKTMGEAESSEIAKGLRKYDTKGLKGYPISSIPLDMFERDEEESYDSYERQDRLDSSDYDTIRKWYEKYQRHVQGWWNKLDKYLGLAGELFPEKDEYVLYRGIKVRSEQVDPASGTFTDKGMSWSWSPSVAADFSKGRDNWMSRNDLRQGELGLVLVHEFDKSEILLDSNFVKRISVDFPSEYEVVVKPVRRTVKIHKIIYPEK